MTLKLRVVFVFSLVLLFGGFESAFAGHAQIFTPPRPFPIPPVDTPHHAAGSIGVNLKELPHAKHLEIPLPDHLIDLANRVGFNRRGERDYTWFGRFEDGGDVVLTVKGNAIAGAMSTKHGNYIIRPHRNGDTRIFRVDEMRLPAEIGVMEETESDHDHDLPTDPPTATEGGTIDVMILYTPQARDGAGGDDAIQATIQSAVDWTNMAYIGSAMTARQRLVYTGLAAYNDSGNMNSDLSAFRIAMNTDGDAVKLLREAHGADLAALIVESGGYCGIAYVMQSATTSFASSAVSVTRRGCMPSTYAHETGHNQGCMHDPDNSGFDGVYDYSFGHRYCMSGGYRTIMSYSCSGGSRIPRFSNPDILYDNGAGALPTGTWSSDCSVFGACRDCAMTIDQTAPIVSQFRVSVDPFCGDGAVNVATEECDGSDLAGESCESLGYTGGTISCNADCTIDVSSCEMCGDGVRSSDENCDGSDLGDAVCADVGCRAGVPSCSSSCTVDYSTCTDCATCGDGLVNQSNEQCDGTDFAEAACADVGCGSGFPTCTDDCTVDYASCTGCATCGDGEVNQDSEQCDGSEFRDATCSDVGCGSGSPTCTSSCTVDYSSCTGCATCGDGVINQASEICDGSDFGAASCSDVGCGSGLPTCTAACTLDYASCTGCPTCGDGVINQESEVCDGDDFGSASCTDVGCGSGPPSCTDSCTIDYSTCTGCPTCGDGLVNQASEQCDGTDFGEAACADVGCGAGFPTCTDRCEIDYASCEECPTCGDGVVNQATEECDGADLGSATCGDTPCTDGTPTCNSDCTLSYDSCTGCPVCDNDGVCEVDENCDSCPSDCSSGDGSTCGNGVCETGNGEDCLSCPSDCAGRQDGRPGVRFCCGDGDGIAAVGCEDSRCSADGFQCYNEAVAAFCCGDGACSFPESGFECEIDCGPPPFCGDGFCNGAETPCSCAGDCGPAPTVELVCGDGIDDDCDGLSDCFDADCAEDGRCACAPAGDSCSRHGDCCEGKCRGRRGTKVCR